MDSASAEFTNYVFYLALQSFTKCGNMRLMTTAIDIADALGRKKMADTLDVGVTAVSNAVVRGSFPAAWFLAVSEMCAGRGIDCPPSLFNMKAAREAS